MSSHLVSLLLSQRCTFLFDLRRVLGDVYLASSAQGSFVCISQLPSPEHEISCVLDVHSMAEWSDLASFINLFCNMRVLTPSLSRSHTVLCLLPEVPQSSVPCFCFLYVFKVALHKHRLLLHTSSFLSHTISNRTWCWFTYFKIFTVLKTLQWGKAMTISSMRAKCSILFVFVVKWAFKGKSLEPNKIIYRK